MLRRLLLALLMLMVAVPAAAAPALHVAQAPVEAATAHCHEDAARKAHHPDGKAPMAQHGAICCAAFYGAPAIAASEMPPASRPAHSLATDGLAQPRAGPEAPPPKF